MISSKWILGFAGEPRTDMDGEWYDTFIGGQPVYPENLSVSIPSCPLCGANRTLVLQAFAPHISHSERTIYLFGCNSIKCASDQQSWFAMRLCKELDKYACDNEREEDFDGTQGELDLGERVQGGAINWDTDSDSGESTSSDLVADLAALSLQLEQAKQDTEKRAMNEAKTTDPTNTNGCDHGSSFAVYSNSNCLGRDVEPSHSQSSLYLDSYYVEVEEEPQQTKPLVDDREVDRLLGQYEKEERSRGTSGETERWETEVEEQELAAFNFEVFQNRISRAPEQILRYCFDREPIWPKCPRPATEANTNCECGSPLVFEVQILGSCLHYLQPEKSVHPDREEAGMNFAAVAIYTCRADCTNMEVLAHSPSFKAFRQTVVVQQDEW